MHFQMAALKSTQAPSHSALGGSDQKSTVAHDFGRHRWNSDILVANHTTLREMVLPFPNSPGHMTGNLYQAQLPFSNCWKCQPKKCWVVAAWSDWTRRTGFVLGFTFAFGFTSTSSKYAEGRPRHCYSQLKPSYCSWQVTGKPNLVSTCRGTRQCHLSPINVTSSAYMSWKMSIWPVTCQYYNVV